MSGVNTPNIPYFGGTDNPGDNTALASNSGAVNTEPAGRPTVASPPFQKVAGGVPLSDTNLGGLQAVPPAASGFEQDPFLREADTGGPSVRADGSVHEPGQDETIGESETTSGAAPAAFPEPTP